MKITLNVKYSDFCAAQIAIVTVVIFLALLSYVFFLITGHDSVLGFLPLLDVHQEQSIPTYVSVINLFLGSILCLTIYTHEKTNNRDDNGYWLFLSILFLYLSLDESAGIHENFSNVYRYLERNEWIPPIMDIHQWVPFGVFFVLVISLVLLQFLRRLSEDTRRYYIFSGVVFVSGALGLEYLGAWMLENGIAESGKDPLYLVAALVEESFEMFGVVIFNCASYREILRRDISIEISG